MAETVRFSDTITIRLQDGATEFVNRMARTRGQKPAEYARQRLYAGLGADGFDPAATEQSRTAGELYDEIEGAKRYALVTNAGAILSMSYSDAKPEADDRGTWIPVTHLDSQQFDIALHWRLPPLYVIHDTYGKPTHVTCTYQVVAKSLSFA